MSEVIYARGIGITDATLGKPRRPKDADHEAYYAANVICRAGAFVMIALMRDEFAAAFQGKLIRQSEGHQSVSGVMLGARVA